jgi:hypothetical protein
MMRAAAPKKHAMPVTIIQSGLSMVWGGVEGNEFPMTAVTGDMAFALFMWQSLGSRDAEPISRCPAQITTVIARLAADPS